MARDLNEAAPLDRLGLWWLLDHIKRADGVDEQGNRPPVEEWSDLWGND